MIDNYFLWDKMKNIRKFLGEEKAQGAIEYILITGGVIVAAITVVSIYAKMLQNTAQAMESSSENVMNAIENQVQTELSK
jgi:uncharacterized protein (UPF0333 family)